MEVNNEYRDWLALCLAKGIGPTQCHKLLNIFKTPYKILTSDYHSLSSAGISKVSIDSLHSPDNREIEKVLEWLNQKTHHLITVHDDDYPNLLKEIHDAPIVLFAIGQREILTNIHFAVVGSRNPSASGKKLAENFTYELALSGLTICSGLALGIDYYSHMGALRANRPTVAVLGNGLNRIYPARHKKIATEIENEGLLISEFFPDVLPMPGNFPRRNRIISGLSVGVLVVEAAKKSGSLITANHALEQGREVFAIPGSINNPLARGTHSLIKEGAKLVENTEDILEELLPLVSFENNSSYVQKENSQLNGSFDEDYRKLLGYMSYDPVSVDYLVELSGLTADVVCSMLLVLELRGAIEPRHGGKYCRCK